MGQGKDDDVVIHLDFALHFLSYPDRERNQSFKSRGYVDGRRMDALWGLRSSEDSQSSEEHPCIRWWTALAHLKSNRKRGPFTYLHEHCTLEESEP